MKNLNVGGCEIYFAPTKLQGKLLVVKATVIAHNRSFEVDYGVDEITLEVIVRSPTTYHREMERIHAEWRRMGVMTKIPNSQTWLDKFRGWPPTYRRFFQTRVWE